MVFGCRAATQRTAHQLRRLRRSRTVRSSLDMKRRRLQRLLAVTASLQLACSTGSFPTALSNVGFPIGRRVEFQDLFEVAQILVGQ